MANDPKYMISAAALKTICQLGAVAMCDMFGVNTEISFTRASEAFGKDFRQMVRAGRLMPVRKGKGKNGIHWYAVSDILALRAEEEAKAKLI